MDKNIAIEFDKLEDQLTYMYLEIGKLSSKKSDGIINSFKLKIINALLQNANELFETGKLPIAKFALFQDEDLPSYSDITFLLTQYLEKLDYFRFQNTETSYGSCCWIVGKAEKLKTKYPHYLHTK